MKLELMLAGIVAMGYQPAIEAAEITKTNKYIEWPVCIPNGPLRKVPFKEYLIR